MTHSQAPKQDMVELRPPCRNKKAIENKYCQRQAELGVGDCGGLRFIPGATKSGKQKTPDWLAKILGVEPQEDIALDLFKD